MKLPKWLQIFSAPIQPERPTWRSVTPEEAEVLKREAEERSRKEQDKWFDGYERSGRIHVGGGKYVARIHLLMPIGFEFHYLGTRLIVKEHGYDYQHDCFNPWEDYGCGKPFIICDYSLFGQFHQHKFLDGHYDLLRGHLKLDDVAKTKARPREYPKPKTLDFSKLDYQAMEFISRHPAYYCEEYKSDAEPIGGQQ